MLVGLLTIVYHRSSFVPCSAVSLDTKGCWVLDFQVSLMIMKKEIIEIYCDGACSGNQFKSNKGGWGAIVKRGDEEREIFGGERNTTNQRMELTACIQALDQLPRGDVDIQVYSDSAYLINCMHQKWYEKWQRNGWRNAKKEPVENKDLWVNLLALVTQHKPTFNKVRGHSGIELNEQADALAQRGIRELVQPPLVQMPE